MNRLFSKLHISSLIQSKAIYSREFASTATTVAHSKVQLPKATANPYALFVKTRFQKGIPAPEQFASIAKEWKTSSEKEKKKFKEEAAKIRKDAVTEFGKLSKKEQEEKFVEAAKSRADLKNLRRLRAYRKFRKETNCPTRPLNAFMLYRQEKYPVITKEDIATSAKKAAEEYKNLSDDQKKPYVDKYNQELKKYKADYEKWFEAHGEEYKALKKEHAKTKKVATKTSSAGRKKSMGLNGRLKTRRTKRKATPKRKKTAKVASHRK